MRVRKMQEKPGWAFGIGVPILRPLLVAVTRQEWIGGENLPEKGGFIIAMNHISHVDPVTAGHLIYEHGRVPRYLAKAGLFEKKGLGTILRGAEQIPVKRDSRDAVGAFAAAVEAVRDGRCVVVYPEATITRDPHMWPMKGKSGAARIALDTGCPVIPIGQWGAQNVLPPYTKKLHLRERHLITMRVGGPIDLDDLRAQPRTAAVVNQATDRIMRAITEQVALIRGEEPPGQFYDMARQGDRFKKSKAE